ncbi:hypothetical protein D3C81_2229680 [compost metagenome]
MVAAEATSVKDTQDSRSINNAEKRIFFMGQSLERFVVRGSQSGPPRNLIARNVHGKSGSSGRT